MAQRIELSPETFAEVRRRYFETADSMEAIAHVAEISKHTLYARVVEWNWPLRGGAGMASHRRALLRRREAAAAVEAGAGAAAFDAAAGDGPPGPVALAARLRAAVEEELALAERALRPLPGRPRRPAEMERTARTLASLVKTLGELRRYDAAAPGAVDDDEGDLDTLRAELSRRLNVLCAEADAESARLEAAGAAADA